MSNSKRFEATGEIAFVSLLKLAFVLDALQGYGSPFAPKAVVSMADITQKKRARGADDRQGKPMLCVIKQGAIGAGIKLAELDGLKL